MNQVDQNDRQKFLYDVVDVLSAKSLHSLTGADFYALCSDAMLTAISRSIKKIESEKMVECSTEIFVRRQDFVDAAEKLVPSVSENDLGYYENFQTN